MVWHKKPDSPAPPIVPGQIKPDAQPIPAKGAILPQKRIVAYYGTPASRRMGVLGQYPKSEMLRRLHAETERWRNADPTVPVQPALHVIGSVALKTPGTSGYYRQLLPDNQLRLVHEWARKSGALLFIDIQTGHESIRTLLPRFEWLLKEPDVHLGIDPEFNLAGSKTRPGKRVGSYDAKDINYVSCYLQDLVKRHNIPPKVFVVHRFTRNGVTNSAKIRLCPEVQVVMDMDGWGAPGVKRQTYRNFIATEPVQYTGFKLFYRNDAHRGGHLMEPKEVLALSPRPLYIQYQ